MKPKLAFFDFTSCEGCQLDILDLGPQEVIDLLNAVDIVNFREAKTIREENYDIAFIEGCISRESEIARLEKIRKQAKVLVAMGTCASTGGLNCLKNHMPMEEALRIVYGDDAKNYNTIPARPINAVVKVDYYIRGCPPTPVEYMRVIKALLLGKQPEIPNYPVCVECKMAENVCAFERDMTCLGPVYRAGCGAICATSGRSCWGCRGLVDNPNTESEKTVLQKHGLTLDQTMERFKIYNSYAGGGKMTQVNINVNQVTRIEGHGNIILNSHDGKIEKLMWEVTESPRLFEAMLRGRYYNDVSTIASRICGICSISHSTASIKATEAAFGIKVSEQTHLLRKLLFNAEILESHVLHAYFLVAPDCLGVDSVFPLIDTHKEVVVRALNLKRLAYDLAGIIAGRKTHPLSLTVGGFAKLPELSQLKDIRKRLQDSLADFDATVALFKTLTLPIFERDTEYIALSDTDEYAFLTGDIASSDAASCPVDGYLNVTNEFCVPYSTAKYTKNKRGSYMVGALSRFNLNSRQLLPKAKKAARELGLIAPVYNPYMITVAQVVEAVNAAEDALNIIDRLLETGLKEEKINIKVKAGRGVGAVEAPRGLLIHDYTYDENGLITNANCIIPTNQNHNNIQKDMDALVPGIIDKSEDDIRQRLEMLVRAYDPCVSCSTHMLKVEFK